VAVITISRGSFSGGKMLAECLAGQLNYRCVDRDVIVEKAAAYGVSQERLRDALLQPPSFWDRFTHGRYTYLTLIQAALAEEVREGRTVYHGNAGHLLLRGVSHVLRTRIIAPMELRVSMVQDRLKMGRGDALAYVHKMDQDRQKWTHYLYGVDWGDPALYDVVLNLECLNIRQGCEVIATTALQPCFEETPDSRAAMDDLVLASRVRATLVMAPETANIEVDVTAKAGSVGIKGKLPNPRQARLVREVVERVPGVVTLDLDLFTDPQG
jgi:cytidylate kinase